MQAQETSNEERPKAENQIIDVIEHLREQWQDGFTLDNPQLVENYIKGKLHFLIIIKDAIKPENQFVALIERAVPKLFIGDDTKLQYSTEINVGRNIDPFFFEHVPCQSPPEKAGSGKVRHDGTSSYQEAVLVDVVKLTESPEKIVPSLVRFGIIDSIYSRLRHALYFSFARGFVLCGAVRVDYGKTDLLLLPAAKGNALLGASDLHQMPSEMVKGASQVLDSLPGNQGDSGCHGLNTGDIMLRECVGKLRIWLDTNFIRITIQEGLDSYFQILDVLVGPCGPYANKPDSLIDS
ncbi:MAG TPA: hypothetical protein VKB05_21620 [Pyrinomonadaceae bacterium]|nr:hypothetical protein [Pyrinomonadaceae bacterium]